MVKVCFSVNSYIVLIKTIAMTNSDNIIPMKNGPANVKQGIDIF